MFSHSFQRVILVASFLMCCFFTRVAAQQAPLDTAYQQKLIEFQQLLQGGQLAEGVALLDDLIRTYPQQPDAYYAKSLLFAQRGDLENSLGLAKDAVRLRPDDLTYNNHLLGIYKSIGNADSVIHHLDALLSYYPNNAAVLREKMLVLHAAGNSEEALHVYDDVLSTIGASDTLDVVKAEILVDLERYEDTKKLLIPWYRKRSPMREVYATLSYAYNQLDEYKQAVQSLEDGLTITGNHVLYFDLADLYTSRQKNQAAFVALQQAFRSTQIAYPEKFRVMSQLTMSADILTLDQKQDLANILVLQYPRIPENYNFKGDVLWQQGTLSEAKSLYLNSLGINPRQAETWRKLINVEIADNLLKEAVGHGQEALIHFPENAVIHYFTGVAYVLQADTTLARKHLEQALDFSEDENDYVKSMIYGSLGDLYHQLGMERVSDAAYQEALTLDSTNVSALNNLAYYWSVRQYNLDQAAEYARRATEIEPNSHTFQDTYAWVLFQQGNYKDAQYWIEKAVKDPNPSAVVIEHYGDILVKRGKVRDAVRQWQKALNLGMADESVEVERLKMKIRERKYVE